MKFLAIADIGGNPEAVAAILQLDLHAYDFVLFCGDLIAMKELRRIGEATAMGTKLDAKIDYGDIRRRLEEINKVFNSIRLSTRLYGILGNSDLKSFVDLVPSLQFENIHRRVVRADPYFLVGYGGRPMNVDEIERPNEIEKADIFPGRKYGERAKECNAWAEEEAYADLCKMIESDNPRRCIMVTHYPPRGILDKIDERNIPWAVASYGKKAEAGNIGSSAFHEASQRYEVLLHVFSHVHESKGTTRVGRTTYVNVGSLEDGSVCEFHLHEEEVNIRSLEIT